ncbi:MAG: M20 family metallopeptidase, partial [Chloroflexota bacterium]
LVRTRTVNPPGDEAPLAAALGRRLAAAGFATEILDHGDGRASLLATIGAGDRAPLILSGHLDTVPIGEVAWTDDPFGATIRDGRVWGRGTTDMKGGVAAIVVAAERLAAGPLRGPLVVALSADEEVGTRGARALVAHPGFPRAGNLVVGEPTGLRPGIAEKGALWVEIRCHGKAAHGAYAHEGASATLGLVAAIPGVLDVVRPLPAHPLLGPTTANLAMLGGGSAPNMVADRAWAKVDVRSAPGTPHAEILAAMNAALAAAPLPAGVRAEIVVVSDRRSFATAPDHPLVTAATAALAGAGVADTTPLGLSYYTDAAEILAGGDYTALILGPGVPGLAHQVDEHVPVDDLVRGTDAYTALGRALLG